jgi:hypothetical protein
LLFVDSKLGALRDSVRGASCKYILAVDIADFVEDPTGGGYPSIEQNAIPIDAFALWILSKTPLNQKISRNIIRIFT